MRNTLLPPRGFKKGVLSFQFSITILKLFVERVDVKIIVKRLAKCFLLFGKNNLPNKMSIICDLVVASEKCNIGQASQAKLIFLG